MSGGGLEIGAMSCSRWSTWAGTTAMLLLVAAGAVTPLAAQKSGMRQGRAPDSVGRAHLEGELRRRFAQAVRERVELSEDQMRRLQPIALSHEQQRRRLQLDERQTRTTLRETMRTYQVADSSEVSRLLQTLVDVQKRRVQLLETEQRELASVMSPVQRARYMALQEQFRRRVEQLRHRRAP